MLIAETDLTEIEVAHGDLKIRVARNVTITAPVHFAPQPAPYAPPAPPAVPAAAPGTAAPVSDHANHPGLVKSPMVGTAYRASEPGNPPFVDIGTRVREGQTLLIIEAMKTMNQIPAPRAGTVTAILFDDAAPVEYGEPLVVIE
jgi:acetyl-CoA carboxylase biotin carboxyl carrier protein